MEIETNYQCLSLCPVVSRRGIPRVPTPQSAGRGNNGRINDAAREEAAQGVKRVRRRLRVSNPEVI